LHLAIRCCEFIMQGRLFLASLALLLAGCASAVPLMTPLAPTADDQCQAVYPVGDWQFVHAIEFTMAEGGRGTAIGITTLRQGDIDCALLTVEGLSLFEANQSRQGGLDIRRALPPFDRPGFAAGLFDDVRTIFFPPAAASVVHGVIGRERVCRHSFADGRVTDVLPQRDGCWQIRTYRQGRDERSLQAGSCRVVEGARIPEYLELRGRGPSGYTLRMTLVRAERTATPTSGTEIAR